MSRDRADRLSPRSAARATSATRTSPIDATLSSVAHADSHTAFDATCHFDKSSAPEGRQRQVEAGTCANAHWKRTIYARLLIERLHRPAEGSRRCFCHNRKKCTPRGRSYYEPAPASIAVVSDALNQPRLFQYAYVPQACRGCESAADGCSGNG